MAQCQQRITHPWQRVLLCTSPRIALAREPWTLRTQSCGYKHTISLILGRHPCSWAIVRGTPAQNGQVIVHLPQLTSLLSSKHADCILTMSKDVFP